MDCFGITRQKKKLGKQILKEHGAEQLPQNHKIDHFVISNHFHCTIDLFPFPDVWGHLKPIIC